MKLQNKTLSHGSLIHLHDHNWLDRQRVAGHCVAEIMAMLQQLVKEKTKLSLLEIDSFVEAEILKRKCTPTFKNYRGFPNSICLSVNKQLVHGIAMDYKLQDGDLISFDFGATFEEAIVDSATTVIFGTPYSNEHIRLVETTKKCLLNAINSISIGRRLGEIGNAIYKTAHNAGFNVITALGGHSIAEGVVHAPPFIPNKSTKEEGMVFQPGFVAAIEPLLVPHNCSLNTKVEKDGWTITTDEIGSHEEHTIFLHEDGIEVVSFKPGVKFAYGQINGI